MAGVRARVATDMITRMLLAAALGALLATALGPDPAKAYDGPVVLIGTGAGLAAIGLAAALLGRHASAPVYPAPSVVYVTPQRPTATPPASDGRGGQKP